MDMVIIFIDIWHIFGRLFFYELKNVSRISIS
jgi:hypothetical protein